MHVQGRCKIDLLHDACTVDDNGKVNGIAALYGSGPIVFLKLVRHVVSSRRRLLHCRPGDTNVAVLGGRDLHKQLQFMRQKK